MSKPIKVQDTLEYQQRRVQIQKEINEDKVSIDRECFKKSTIEKLELKKRISEYKQSIKK
jgi:hypothetical protein